MEKRADPDGVNGAELGNACSARSDSSGFPAEKTAAESKRKPSAKESKTAAPSAFNDYYRAPNEDDDGYDPYSDRRYEPPLFERDPWD